MNSVQLLRKDRTHDYHDESNKFQYLKFLAGYYH